MKTIIITILVSVVLYEAVEHLVFPLVWYFVNRKKRSISGASGMLGQTVTVKDWEKTSGRVYFQGELWRAVSDTPLTQGSQAVIEQVEGLTLHVKPWIEPGRLSPPEKA